MTPSKSKASAKSSAELSLNSSAEPLTNQPTIKKPASFEHAFSELENIVAQMESGQMPLEASLKAYQRGNTLLQFCQKSLADVEQQVQILNERNQLVLFKTQDE